MMLRNPTRTPKIIQLRGIIPAANASTFFYKDDSLGISATGTFRTGGIAFTAPVGFSIAAINAWLNTYALVVKCLNQNVSDANQVANSLRNQYLSLDGDHDSKTTWAPSYEFASNQNQNLLNVGQALIITNQSFLTFPIASDALVDVTVNITFKNIISVPYAKLDAYLQSSGLKDVSGEGC